MKQLKNFKWQFGLMLEKIRANKVRPYLSGRVLDIGCCAGSLVPYINDRSGYVGVDINQRVIDIHKRKYPENTLYCLDVQEEKIPVNGKFDTMVALAVIEHLERPDAFFENYISYVKPGGTLVLTTPTPVGDRIHKMLQKLKIANPVVSDVHFCIYKREQLAEIVRKYGVQVSKIELFELGMNQILVGVVQ
ncbi:MAG: class I SAM-dependent methyltransferase [Actinobacteria bacterium]|nr:class I SAM-dependent methyltransferase [Actinomycetota bacterium]